MRQFTPTCLHLKFLGIGLLCLMCVQCKKDETKPKNSYFPQTNGSTWQYAYLDANDHQFGTAHYSITGTATIDGKTWNTTKVYFEGGGTRYFYMREEDGTHYEADSFKSNGVGIETHTVLKQDSKAGDKWVDSLSGKSPFRRYYATTVSEVGLNNIEVQGKVYNDVILYNCKYLSRDQWERFRNEDYYVAKGVGMIKWEDREGGFKLELKSYEIK